MSSIPEVALLFDKSFEWIFLNYLPVFKYLPFMLGPYLLSFMTNKISEKNFLFLFAMSLIIFRFFFEPSQEKENHLNLVLDENQIILGTFFDSFY